MTHSVCPRVLSSSRLNTPTPPLPPPLSFCPLVPLPLYPAPDIFYTVPLNVQKGSLADSLSAYVHGEVISDYNCDRCQKKVDITRRQCLKTLR